MSRPAIRVDGLSKCYRIGRKRVDRNLTEAVGHGLRSAWGKLRRLADPTAGDPDRDEFWALKDVSFEVQPGEVVGVIGRNGAGKSTLLKVLSQIVEPTGGTAEIDGRVGSLLEVGTGFHPELTGRENVYLNGSVLGMSRKEIDRQFDAIVEFSGVEQFLDTPVKRYSSGMSVRLGFAVAAHLETEILIVDEVLAVGDAEFQSKCLNKIQAVSRGGRTVLFVSHHMATVARLCDSALLLDAGAVVSRGTPPDVMARYASIDSYSPDGVYPLADCPQRTRASVPLIRRVRLEDGRGTPTGAVGCGEPLDVLFDLDLPREYSPLHLGIGFDNVHQEPVGSVATYFSPAPPIAAAGRLTVRCRIPSLPLVPGAYSLSVSAGDGYGKVQDQVSGVVRVNLLPFDYYGNGRHPSGNSGKVLLRSDWAVTADGPAGGAA